jgi:predicted amidophosphoribosyltransferase
MHQIFAWFAQKVENKIDEIGLREETIVVAVPNSSPEYCYRFDANHVFTAALARDRAILTATDDRILSRVHPKSESHLTGNRSSHEHYRTMGFSEIDLSQEKNIILFDDVTTSGTQLTSAAKMLRYFGFRGNFYCVALAKTR